MISWDFPDKNNLRQLIDSSGFHPITTMQSITKKEKTFFDGSRDNTLQTIIKIRKINLKKWG